MDRRSASSLLTWLLLPVAAYLIQSALTLPGLAYTGVALRGNLVASVDPGSPGAFARLAPGDRLVARGDHTERPVRGDPFRGAAPGHPLMLDRIRAGARQPVWLVPAPLPSGERRLNAGLLAIASVFILLAGWVWSERRDPLTRAFFLVCIAFGCLLPPPPRWASPFASILAEIGLGGLALVLPALFVHFFATFPEARPGERRQGLVRLAYGFAATLFVVGLVANAASSRNIAGAAAAVDGMLVIAAVWFAVGILLSLVLFASSYVEAGSPDARRRLRVALIGCAVGLGPVAAVTALRNVFPNTVIPGERLAMALVVLVPASFAWAIVAHRIFDFRVALRAAAVTLVIGGAAAVACGRDEGRN
jgi:hypothetical protein